MDALRPLFDQALTIGLALSKSYNIKTDRKEPWSGRSAHDALRHALGHQQEGKQWVVEMDLKAFFNEVDHDILISRLGRAIKDKRLKRPWKTCFLGLTFRNIRGRCASVSRIRHGRTFEGK